MVKFGVGQKLKVREFLLNIKLINVFISHSEYLGPLLWTEWQDGSASSYIQHMKLYKT